MRSARYALPFSEFVDCLVRETVRADAQAQSFQQSMWVDFQGSMERVDGIDPTEGVAPLMYLGLQEVKLSFHVEPVMPGWWTRFKSGFRALLGRREAPGSVALRLVDEETAKASGFNATITVSRSVDGGFTARTESDAEGLESARVTNIFA